MHLTVLISSFSGNRIKLMTVMTLNSTTDASRLAQKYAYQGPRYTSYPTALQFSPDFAEQAVVTDLATRRHQKLLPLSLYVHIPFCADICYYCACNKVVTRDRARAGIYLDALKIDIARQAELFGAARPVRQMHWGGGTPTWLDDAEITELMHELASHFHLLDSGSREYAIELDPRTVNAGRVALLSGLGFNRASLGIQDFDPLVQRAINREQSVSDVQDLVDALRRHHFRSISFDLIYGLPFQDSHSMENTLQQVIDLGPERIACYNYAHLPERFSSQRAIDRLTLPKAEEKLRIQARIADTLCTAGYEHIGLDHFVLPHDDLAQAQRDGRLQRNFQGYSVQMADDLVGLGVSAISQIGGYYLQNDTDPDSYCKRLQRGDSPVWRGLASSSEDELRRYVIMQLICNLQLDFNAFQQRFEEPFEQHFQSELSQLAPMASDGLLQIGNSGIQVSETGRSFLRNICMVFDQFLQPKDQQESGQLNYSRTV